MFYMFVNGVNIIFSVVVVAMSLSKTDLDSIWIDPRIALREINRLLSIIPFISYLSLILVFSSFVVCAVVCMNKKNKWQQLDLRNAEKWGAAGTMHSCGNEFRCKKSSFEMNFFAINQPQSHVNDIFKHETVGYNTHRSLINDPGTLAHQQQQQTHSEDTQKSMFCHICYHILDDFDPKNYFPSFSLK